MNKLCRYTIIGISLALGGIGHASAAFRSVMISTIPVSICFTQAIPRDPIIHEADYIMKCQINNTAFGAEDLGCINDVIPGSGPTWVVPRENGTAVLGLIEAYQARNIDTYKIGALRCAEYLKNRQETDNSWCDWYDETAAASASDTRISRNKSPSMAGSAIMAFYKIHKMGWEDSAHQYYESAKKAAGYIIDCVDNKPGAANGLAGAGKEYGNGDEYTCADTLGTYRWSDWSWVSDNCYAYLGLMCMREWARGCNDNDLAEKYNRYACNLLAGINAHLKNPSNAVWYRVVGGNGELVSESDNKIDALCYYPQKYDLPVPQYGSADIAQWMIDNLQINTGNVPSGYGAYQWGNVDPCTEGRRSQGFSEEAWLSLVDIPGDTAKDSRDRAKFWWESCDNTGGRGQLWNHADGGICDWYDPDGKTTDSEGNRLYRAPEWQRFIDTSANCIFVYRGGYDHSLGTGRPETTTLASVGTGGGTVSIPRDALDGPSEGQTSLIIPPGALSTDAPITITQVDPLDTTIMQRGYASASSSQPIAAFSFGPDGLVFNAWVTLKLHYNDRDQNGLVDGTNFREECLRILWWDGIEWRLIGGTVDTMANVVTCQIKHFSTYSLFPVPALADSDYRPKERIITPARADSINDFATFGGLSDGDVVNIYDVNGARVTQLSGVSIWNGRNDNGNIVESGIYIYQIKKASGNIISGTIVVAK